MTVPKPDSTFISLRTNAKLNLFLRVVGLRPDGFHDIDSVFHGIDLADTMELEPAPGTIEVSMEMEAGEQGPIPAPEDNLVHRAARALAWERPELGARVAIRKRIPLGSGLAGGSSNAAGALLALNEMWGLGWDRSRLAEVAAALGSDIPYLLTGGTALVRGRGDDVSALPAPRPFHFVLGLSFEPLSTASVYAAWDEDGSSSTADPAELIAALEGGDAAAVAARLHNDLEVPALSLRPELSDKKELLLEAGALGVGMSGSGPTLFGIGRDENHCSDIAARAQGAFDRVVTATSAPSAVERLT